LYDIGVLKLFAAGRTDIGKLRSQNQDAIFVSLTPVGPLPHLFIVADGMGGHNAGEVASRLAVEYFTEHIRQGGPLPEADGYMDAMVSAAAAANRRVYAQSLRDYALHGMGTTFTACVAENGKCDIVHIGDSRAYWVSSGEISQLTVDHSYVNEMVKAGQLTQAQAQRHPKRNILMRVMGVDEDAPMDGYRKDCESGLILLCSDGLTNMLPDDTIREICVRSAALEERCEMLINEANERGGSDNISVVLIEL
jgi:protein phosphatase